MSAHEASRDTSLTSRTLPRSTRTRRFHPSYPLRSPYSHVRLRPLAHLRSPVSSAATSVVTRPSPLQSSLTSPTSSAASFSDDRSHLPLPARSVHSSSAAVAVERISAEPLCEQNSDETYSHISDLRAGAEREPRDDVAIALGGDADSNEVDAEADFEQFLENYVYGEADVLGSEAYAEADADAEPDGLAFADAGTDSDATAFGTDAEADDSDELTPYAVLGVDDIEFDVARERRHRHRLEVARASHRLLREQAQLLRQLPDSFFLGRGAVPEQLFAHRAAALRRRRAKRVKHNYHTITLLCKLVSLRFSRISLLSLFDRFDATIDLSLFCFVLFCYLKLHVYEKLKEMSEFTSFTTFESEILCCRTLRKGEIAASLFFSLLVSLLGMYILQLGIYYDSALLFFCFVLASCHYTLIKSVQPDPSSPTHVRVHFDTECSQCTHRVYLPVPYSHYKIYLRFCCGAGL